MTDVASTTGGAEGAETGEQVNEQGAAGAEQQGEGQEQQQAAQQPQAPDFDAMFSRFAAQMDTRLGAFEERLPAAPAQVTDPNDPAFYAPEDYEDDGTLTDEAQDRAFWATVNQQVQEGVQRALAPMQEQQREAMIAQQADALEREFPELGNDDVQARVLDAAARAAGQMGLPPEQADLVARSPQFVRTVYLAMKAEEQRASAQTPGSAPSVPLEQGGAAGPVAPPGDADADLANRLVQRAQGSRFRLGM